MYLEEHKSVPPSYALILCSFHWPRAALDSRMLELEEYFTFLGREFELPKMFPSVGKGLQTFKTLHKFTNILKHTRSIGLFFLIQGPS